MRFPLFSTSYALAKTRYKFALTPLIPQKDRDGLPCDHTDWLIFEDGERGLPNSLQLKFETVSQMSEEDKHTVQSLN